MTVFNSQLAKLLRINSFLLQVSINQLQHAPELKVLSRILCNVGTLLDTDK